MNEANTAETLPQESEEVADSNATTEAESSDPKLRKIAANNPTPEQMKELTEHLNVNYDFAVNTQPTVFNFKKTKDESGVVTERESLQIPVPYPSVDGIVKIFEGGGKGLELLIEAIEDVVKAQARSLITDDLSLNAGNFPMEKLSWEFIANMPKAQRRGGGIPKETWEAFAVDYVAVMPEVTGKEIDAVKNQANLLKAKFAPVKTRIQVIEYLTQQLAIYNENSPNANEYVECVTFLVEKADLLVNMSDEDMLANL